MTTYRQSMEAVAARRAAADQNRETSRRARRGYLDVTAAYVREVRTRVAYADCRVAEHGDLPWHNE